MCKAEKLYLNAIAELGGTYQGGKIHLANRKEEDAEALTRVNDEKMYVSEENAPESLQFSRSANGEIVPENGQNVVENAPFVSQMNGGVIESKNAGAITSKNVDNYTEEQYNNFGWVRSNDVLNSGEWKDFTSKFAAAVSKQTDPPKTKSGEYMIAVSDIDDTLRYGTDNFIVFAKGSIESPQVSRVLEIAFDDTKDLDKRRRRVYDAGRRGIQPQAGGIFRFNYAADYRNRFYERGESSQMRRNNSQLGADRGAGGRGVVEAERGRVSSTFVGYYNDVAGGRRKVYDLGEGRFQVENARADTDEYYSSPEAAIKAENDSLIKGYAREFFLSPAEVRRKLDADPDLLSRAQHNGIRFSRKGATDGQTDALVDKVLAERKSGVLRRFLFLP